MNITAELKNWSKDQISRNYHVFCGHVYGDIKERFEDGTYIRTSYVKSTEERDDCFIVTTKNSVYRLWKCDKDNSDENLGSLS